MFFANINFSEIPQIGFAHRFLSKGYKNSYGKNKRMSMEFAYIESGEISAELYGEKIYAKEGCVFVLFRHLPTVISSVGETMQSHCTVQAEFEQCKFSLLKETDGLEDGFLFPLVTEPCKETAIIGREIREIVSNMSAMKGGCDLDSSVRFLSIMRLLSEIQRKKQENKSPSSHLIYKNVKRYVEDNIDCVITADDVARYVRKSPNYVNSAFRTVTGMTLIYYINQEKIKRVCSLMSEGLSFEQACFSLGIKNASYAYRLFKKHMGITPGKYIKMQQVHKNSLGTV